MGLYCDACEGDLKIVGEDDKYFHFECKDCGRKKKIKKPVEGEDY